MARRKSSWGDDLVLAPWWVSFVLAVLTYLFLPAIFPVAIRGLALPFAFLFLCIAAISVLRSMKNAWMLDRQTDLNSLRDLSWKSFEDLLGEAYRRKGYKTEETLGGGADGGVDLVLRRDGEVTVVQCKRWKGKPVPVQVVRELYGVLHDRRAIAAKLIATTNFTTEAVAFAEGKPIELVGSRELLRLISSVQTSGRIGNLGASLTKPETSPCCPLCGANMVRRTARRGPNAGSEFWGCSAYPGCRGTRSARDE